MAEEKAKERDMVKEYDALRKKYSLPDLKELDKEFCVGKLEESDFLLRGIMSKMSERLESAFKSLSDIVQPSDSSLSCMYEAEVFSDEEKKAIFELMKKLAYYHRDLVVKDYDYKEEAAAGLINKAFAEWASIKPEVIKLLSKLRDAWNSSKVSKFEAGYFG